MKVYKIITLFCLIIIFCLPFFVRVEDKPEIFVQMGHREDVKAVTLSCCIFSRNGFPFSCEMILLTTCER